MIYDYDTIILLIIEKKRKKENRKINNNLVYISGDLKANVVFSKFFFINLS